MTRKVAVVIAILTSFLAPAGASAQASGQITGSVTDSSGGLLPGVTIEAVNVNTNAVRSAVSGQDGQYVIPLVPPGVYNVKATLQGFKAAQRDGLRVTVTETARAVFELLAFITTKGRWSCNLQYVRQGEDILITGECNGEPVTADLAVVHRHQPQVPDLHKPKRD